MKRKKAVSWAGVWARNMQPHWWDVQECRNRRKEQTKRKNKPQASLWKALTCLWLDPFHKGELWWAGVAACNEYHDNIITPPPTHHCSDYVNRCFYISEISLISTRQIWQMCKKYINYISDSSPLKHIKHYVLVCTLEAFYPVFLEFYWSYMLMLD